jgi:polyisoprenoid-binding protein YceI
MKRAQRFATAVMTLALASTPAAAQSRNGVLHFKVNPAETKITASVAEPMAKIRGSAAGTFNVLSGAVQGDPDSIADTGQVTLTIDAASYKTDSESRDQDVKDNALEVRKFPTITFRGEGFPEIQKNGDLSAKLRLLGQLTLHGVTKDIVLPLAARIDKGRFVADGTYTFRFEEYGVKRPSKMMGLMVTGDEAIDFHVVADPA